MKIVLLVFCYLISLTNKVNSKLRILGEGNNISGNQQKQGGRLDHVTTVDKITLKKQETETDNIYAGHSHLNQVIR